MVVPLMDVVPEAVLLADVVASIVATEVGLEGDIARVEEVMEREVEDIEEDIGVEEAGASSRTRRTIKAFIKMKTKLPKIFHCCNKASAIILR